jgi:hypothetical protein
MRFASLLLISVLMLTAADKKPIHGHIEDETVSIEATVLSPEEVRDAVGSSFGDVYTVLNIRILPKSDKPYNIRPDDFILRNESNGDHSGPLLAGQVAGSATMVVKRTYAARSNPDMPQMVDGMKVEMKDNDGSASHLEQVKKKMLAEQTTTEAQSGLLFFPLDKAKARSLLLSCTTSTGAKLRMQFK